MEDPTDAAAFVNKIHMMNNKERLCAAAREGDIRNVRELLDSGADVSYFDEEGITPLMHAAMGGHTEIVKFLLDSGAPWNAISHSNLSAGDFAMNLGHQEAFELLLTAGVQAELVLGVIERRKVKDFGVDFGCQYLEQRVAFSEDRLTDSEGKAVMMAWERPLMEAHAKAVCSNGGHILNIGFGMGLVDMAIQSYLPASHTIIEAHPEVYDRMISTGWGDKKNVKIIFGRWQDVVYKLDDYDGIFFDTYGECYEDLRVFHEHLPQILKRGGIYSFFNGLCANNAFFHVVYCHLVSMELHRLGFYTQFVPLPVTNFLDNSLWDGLKHKYWQLDTYYLPVCEYID